MQVKDIYSTRSNNREVYADLIYEWEDCISNQLNIPIYSRSRLLAKFISIFERIIFNFGFSSTFQSINKLVTPKHYTLIYHLYPLTSFGFKVSANKIPYLIDFDKNVDVNNFSEVYKNCKLIFVSSLNAYNLLKQGNCPLNIVHLPLGLSDKYKLWRDVSIKRYDAIFVRKNKILIEFAERYAASHPNFNYVIRTWAGTAMYRNNIYISNLDGVLGEFSKREDYIRLLRNTKIAFYSTPGFDEPETKFINHVTPSLFEFMVNGCRIVARYEDNDETNDFGLPTISTSVVDYKQFEKMIDNHINDLKNDYLASSELFLQNIYMRHRIVTLKEILKNAY